MNDKEFHEIRRKGIGGSDIAAIMGMDKWRSPMDVWLEKTGRADPKDETTMTRHGHLMEPIILDMYAERHGLKKPRRQVFKSHPKYKFHRASLDMVAGPVVVDAKAPRYFSREWGEPGTDMVPDYILLQQQWYLILPQFRRAYRRSKK